MNVDRAGWLFLVVAWLAGAVGGMAAARRWPLWDVTR